MNTEQFRRRAAELKGFCAANGYNSRIALLWDLSLHSGRRRFVVWNYAENLIFHLLAVRSWQNDMLDAMALPIVWMAWMRVIRLCVSVV